MRRRITRVPRDGGLDRTHRQPEPRINERGVRFGLRIGVRVGRNRGKWRGGVELQHGGQCGANMGRGRGPHARYAGGVGHDIEYVCRDMAVLRA